MKHIIKAIGKSIEKRTILGWVGSALKLGGLGLSIVVPGLAGAGTLAVGTVGAGLLVHDAMKTNHNGKWNAHAVTQLGWLVVGVLGLFGVATH